MVAVLPQVDRLLGATRAQVHGQHRFDAGLAAPADELIQPELVALHASPGGIEPGGALLDGSDAVFPTVAGHEVAAWIADDADPELTHEVEDVTSESVLVCERVSGFVQTGVDTPAHVLHEAAEDATVDRCNGEARFEHEGGGEHRGTFAYEVMSG